MLKYWKIWKILAHRTFYEMTTTKIDAFGFIAAKLVRIAFLFVFLLGLFGHIPDLAGYSINQVLLFYIFFNIIDIVTQALFRGVYHIPAVVRKGNFDFFLTKPVSPLFISIFWAVDFFDIFTLVPVSAAFFVLLAKSGVVLSFALIAKTAVLFAASFLIIFALHILALSTMVRYLASDSIIWIYRDLNVLGRFPPEVYAKGFRFALTFVIPIFVMVSYPTKALLGLLSIPSILWAVFITFIFLGTSIIFWKNALRNYASASN